MSLPIPQTYQIARFALSKNFEDLGAAVTDQLKKHLLDSTGSLIQCINNESIAKLRSQISLLSNSQNCLLPAGIRTSFDRGAQLFTAMIRYPNFMDNFLGKEATCHPSDNIGSLLAGAQMMNATGRDLLLSMAIWYEIECRLIEEIPVMIKGFDHCLLLAYSVTAALCNQLKLTEEQTANALAMAGCSFNPLVSCRASYTREWKGFQSSFVAFGCFNIVLLAREGLTGPTNIFEGNKGFQKEFNMELKYNWTRDKFDLIPKCILKNFNAEVHTQSLLEAALLLKKKYRINPAKIKKIEVTTFLTTFHIVGGGEYGDRKTVYSKEQADHSLPYVLAVILLDDKVYPEQFLPSRINSTDVQELLKKVEVNTKLPLHKPMKLAGALDPYTKAYPKKMRGKLRIQLENGTAYSLETSDYYGFHTRPMSWNDVMKKFRKLSEKNTDKKLQDQIIKVISQLEDHTAADLIKLLSKTGQAKRPARSGTA